MTAPTDPTTDPKKRQPTPRGKTTVKVNEDRVRFEYRGAWFTIYKKYKGAEKPWYFSLWLEGSNKPIRHCLKTSLQDNAIITAKALLEGRDKNRLLAVRAALSPEVSEAQAAVYSPVTDLIAKWETMEGLDISARFRRDCVYCLKHVLKTVYGDKGLAQHCGIFTPELVTAYLDKRTDYSRKAATALHQTRAKRSSNYLFNSMLSMFTPSVLGKFHKLGIGIADEASGMRAAFKENKFKGVTAEYEPPSDALIKRTLHAWARGGNGGGNGPGFELPAGDRGRNMFLAIGIMLAFGLRRSEVSQVTWGMFTRTCGSPILDSRAVGSVQVKNHSARFTVPPLDPFWTVMMRRVKREGWRGADTDLVITGSYTERTEAIYRDIGRWLRAIGWKMQKTNHALRAYSGSMVAAKWGIYRASAWLRHSSVKVTEQHYDHFVKEHVFKPEKILMRFAR